MTDMIEETGESGGYCYLCRVKFPLTEEGIKAHMHSRANPVKRKRKVPE